MPDAGTFQFDEYRVISGVPVLRDNVIFMFFRKCLCYQERDITGTQKCSGIFQYLHSKFSGHSNL